MVLEKLSLLPDMEQPVEKPLPWRQSLGLNRRDENVRPIFWRNRNRAYIERTQDWDEFPNGRWGDSRSPAFGEIDSYNIGLKGTNEKNREIWGEPKTLADISSLFVKYMMGKVESLPWSESAISMESDVLRDNLVSLNTRCLLTINSQPPVNGVKSTHPVYGWGPRNGYVYQKAYLEVLISPEVYSELLTRIERNDDLTYYAVNEHGDLHTNAPGEGSRPNAVTWGVFPGKEIVQPTIVETISFLAWKDEFFRLGRDWAHCYEASSPSRALIESLMDSWYLVNIGTFRTLLHGCPTSQTDMTLLVHNDFQDPKGIFPLFEGLGTIQQDRATTSPEKVMTNGDLSIHINGNGELKN